MYRIADRLYQAGIGLSARPEDVYKRQVVKVGWETGYGNTIEIDHGFGYLTRYAHLQSYNTKVGKKVVRCLLYTSYSLHISVHKD